MTLSEFAEEYEKDDNVFWRLAPGDLQIILEDAIQEHAEDQGVIRVWRGRTERAEDILREVARFLGDLPSDLGKGSLNGRKAQLSEMIRSPGRVLVH